MVEGGRPATVQIDREKACQHTLVPKIDSVLAHLRYKRLISHMHGYVLGRLHTLLTATISSSRDDLPYIQYNRDQPSQLWPTATYTGLAIEAHGRCSAFSHACQSSIFTLHYPVGEADSRFELVLRIGARGPLAQHIATLVSVVPPITD